ncbi:hypothetical protein G6O69_24945 [Pseudenhygromyxa sp. WMMC2535]|uniref:hypothetical protein n=1 Tax=Pseudenhygromyxa sp. WMMC2535 TaxID=2712867 RepID=UPI001552B2E8|nr:hypothetical protein [Pseudenhygromyxa sp. WMMC2535]NVB41111.1 hypothetical protein [Pseudenhygromyxa sp. WMMC2535]
MKPRPPQRHIIAPLLCATLGACHRPSATLELPTETSADAEAPDTSEIDEPPSEDNAGSALDAIRAAPLDGRVALSIDASLFTRSERAAELGRLSSKHAYLMPWRVHEDAGAFVAIESLPHAERPPSCFVRDDIDYRVDAAMDRYRLRAWVERSALQLVTSRELELRFADGSGVVLGAVMPVLESGHGDGDGDDGVGVDVGVDYHGFARSLPIPLDGLALSWPEDLAPGLSSPTPVTSNDVDYEHPDILLLDGVPLRLDDLDFPLREVDGWGAVAEDPNASIWYFADSCIQLELLGPKPTIVAQAGLGAGGGGGGYGSGSGSGHQDHWQIPANTPAYWPDGSDAGESLRKQIVLDTNLTRRGELACLPLVAQLEICHAQSDLVHVP